MAAGSLRIFRIAGIDIYVHFSWIIVFLLVTISLATGVLPTTWSEPKQIAVAAFAALLFFGSVLAHELSHSLVARRYGLSVRSITLFLLGGVAGLTEEPTSAAAELRMAVAGPLASFAIASLTYAVQIVATPMVDPGWMANITPVTSYLATVNIAVGIFNLVPAFPLDGGRVLRSILWALRGDRAWATRIAARGGQVFAFVLGLTGLGLLLLLGEAAGLWYLVLGYFLYGMARSSLDTERIKVVAGGVRVAELMTADAPTASPEMSLDALVRDVMLPFNARVVLVTRGDALAGMVTIRELRTVDHDLWPSTTVGQVMVPAEQIPVVDPDDKLTTALERSDGAPLVPVVRGARLVGVLFVGRLLAYLKMRETLGIPGAPRGAASA